MSGYQLAFGFRSVLFVLINILMLSACQQGVEEKPVKPNDFVSSYTSGQISSNSQVRVVLNLPEELENISEQPLTKEVLSFTPKIEGEAYWADRFTILFVPDEPLPNGKKYAASLNLEKLLNLSDQENARFDFYFSVIPLSFDVEITEMVPYQKDNEEKKWQYIEGRIHTSDVIDEGLISKLLSANQGNKKLKMLSLGELSHNNFGFRVDSINRLNEKSYVTLEWLSKAEATGFNDDGIMIIPVPPINSFGLMRVKVYDDPDQYVMLEFSDPVDDRQNLQGLIYFSDQSPARLQVDENIVMVYPDQRMAGENSITIKKAVKTKKGVSLQDDVFQGVYFGQQKPAARFTSEGNIMPGEDGWILPFEAVNLNAVDVIIRKIHTSNIQQFLQVNRISGKFELNRVGSIEHIEKVVLDSDHGKSSWKWIPYALDLSKMINKEMGAIYRVELRFNRNYSTYDCGSDRSNTNDNIDSAYYKSDYYYPSGYSWVDRDDPCTPSYYQYDRFRAKNVLASNIGLTIKEDDDRLLVYANDLVSTNPLEGVNISIFDFRQQELVQSMTNALGVASLEKVEGRYLVVAEKYGEYAFQRIDHGSALSYSRFDTEGESVEKGIKGFIYGERGVWRPGDELFLTLIIDDRDNPLPGDHPVTMRLYNPRGKQVMKKTSTKGMNGFYKFTLSTDTEAMTGFYRAVVEVGGAKFEKSIRIESIKPNRLKINLDLAQPMLTRGKNKASMQVSWLHGGTASGLKADVNATIRPARTSFEGYKSYHFDDPARYFNPEDLVIFDGKLNQQGRVDFDFTLPEASYAPGMLNVTLATKAYEHGGDFSIDQFVSKYSPFDFYIGIRDPMEDRSGYLEVDTEQEFEVVLLNKAGVPVDMEDLEYEVYKLDWSWWYGSNSRNLASYISRNYDRKILSGTIKTKDGKGSFKIKLTYPDWGWYYIRVKNPYRGHQTGLKVYFDWPSYYSRENRKAPGGMSLLSLTTDKEVYQIGDEVKVSVPTPANARLLISLEKGSRQLSSWDMEAEGAETTISFEATSEMTPNVYLYVSVLQPHSQTVNDLPIRMYGLVPVLVEDKATVLHPDLIVPENVRPGETYIVKVGEKEGRPMTYTLAVVDEGLLDLTRFRTPVPHKYFYKREALSVKTWDLYDYVMGAFGGRLEKVFAIGGDMEARMDGDKKKANRFKPVVTYLGPFEIKAGETKSHKIQMPNYVGSVRCMVVAGQDGAYGNVDKTFPVRQPLMVLGTLPRVLAPGEHARLPVSIFVMDEKISKVKVRVETNELFNVERSSKEMEVEGMGEHLAFFDVKVAGSEGVGKVKIEVISGAEAASYEMELQVRNPNQRVYEVDHHLVSANETWDYQPVLSGTAGTNQLNITVSATPPLNLEKRLKYLIRYPYGCIEQTTSSVFPQLYLDQLLNLDPETERRVEQNIKMGISRIGRFALSNGAFSYWPGGGSASDWSSSYAGHFLLLAREKGYHVPAGLINNWINYQRDASNEWQRNPWNDHSQAYRLYTLALAGKPNVSAMNRMREEEQLSVSARFRLAAAYALLGQQKVAMALINNIEAKPEESKIAWRNNYGSTLRDLSMILETYLLLDDKEEAFPLFSEIAAQLRSNAWMSTQTTAFALYASSLFVDEAADGSYHFSYVWNNKNSDEIRGKTAFYSADLEIGKTNKLVLKNLTDQELYVTTTASGIPMIDKPIDIQKNMVMEIKYFNMTGEEINETSIPHGMDFYAEVTVQNGAAYGYLNNFALSQIFPSGWEIINTRMLDVSADLVSDKSDFVDFRDDRVNTFFDLGASQSKRFIVLLNAAYQGRFFLPATKCGPMYSNEVSSSIGGGWVEVKK